MNAGLAINENIYTYKIVCGLSVLTNREKMVM